MKRQPRIAIAYWRSTIEDRIRHYIRCLREAGAEPALHRPDEPFQGYDALLLAGGTTDINPNLYGERRGPTTIRPNLVRDRHELDCLNQALTRDLPVLGVCRGHQLINVAFGGSLSQEIPGHSCNPKEGFRWHRISLAEKGRIPKIYRNRRGLLVNSCHHQAVTPERLAPSLVGTATSPDGCIEALESRDHNWVVGVQWHPERPQMSETSVPLFSTFLKACR